MFHLRVLLASASFVALLPAVAVAQGVPSGPADTSTHVDEVVVTAAPFALSADSVTSNVDIMRRDELDQAPPGGIGDVLSELPGIRSTFFGPGASRPVIRGLSGPRVLVLTNGLGQIDASALSPDHQVASDPGEAERIEVLRGPGALLYGGSAIGGIVNVIDERIPTRAPAGPLEGRFTAYGTTVDDGYNLSGMLKAKLGNFVLAIDGLHRQTDDYDVPVPAESDILRASEGEPPLPDEGATVPNSAVNLTTFGAGLSYVGDWGFVGASVKHVDTRYGVPGHSHAHEEGEEDHDHDHDHEESGLAPGHEEGVVIELKQTRGDFRGEVRHDFGNIFDRVRFAAGYAEYEHAEIEDGEVGTRFTSHGAEGRLELVHPSHDGHDGAIGVQALTRQLDAIGDEAYVPKTDITEFGLFTLQRLDRDTWGVEGGLRIDNRRLDSVLAERDFTNVSASLGAFWRPSSDWFMGASISRTSRAPTESELFANGAHVATRGFEVGDLDLDSEVSYSFDGTIHYGAGRLEADLHLFAVRYDGFIDLRPTGDEEDGLAVFAYRQTDAEFHGFEAELSYRVWGEKGDRNLRVEGAADYVRGDTDLGAPARIPPPSVAGRLVWQTPRYELRGEVRHVFEQDRLAEFELPTAAYTLVNASAMWRPFPDRGAKLFLDVRNITNEEAREHASFLKDLAPLPGRNFRLGVSYEF